MNSVTNKNEIRYPFLEGGGEMGELTRAFDWASTPVGPVGKWPSTLRTTVGNLLHTNFPMFLWWGEDMIQFYNDGYRPSLGEDGKHPTALGQRGEECWPEIWEIIFPLIQKVKIHRESFYLEDQLVPIFRNGKIEDVYWTFSYSPVIGDTDLVEGVLVICTETTKAILAIKESDNARISLQQSEANLTNVFMQAPSAMAILEGSEHRFRLANDKYMQLVGKDRNIIGLTIREALPEIDPGFYDLLDQVVKTGEPCHGYEVSVSLDTEGTGQLQEAFVDFVYQPYVEASGKTIGVLVHAVDITEQVVSRKKAEQSEKHLRDIIREAHVPIAIYMGRDMIISSANDAMIKVWGKDPSVLGMPLRHALPELEGQPFNQLLQDVYDSGETYWAKEDRVDLVVGGKLQTGYFNFTYKPLKDLEGKVYGILNMAIDVSDQVLARTRIERNEANLRNLIMKAPVAMCLLIGEALVIETANDYMITVWGKRRDSVMGKPVFDALPDAREQGLEVILDDVFTKGNTFTAHERPVQLLRYGRLDTVYQNFVYQPHRNLEGNIIGVLVITIDVTHQVILRQQIEELVAERTKQLNEAVTDLKQSNEALSQFAYIASHDIQEPARKIATFIDMLRMSLGEVDARSKGYINKIENSSTRMLTLIRDVLAFSQVSTPQIKFSPVDLNEVVKNVKKDFEIVVEEKNAMIISDELPIIDAIPVQINQLFSNLISNSLKFVDRERLPEIKITSRKLSPAEIEQYSSLNNALTYFQIDLSDNGIGFKQSNADQIFEIFKRLHGKSEYEGTGIGLAICKKVVQNHQGEITASSVKGSGATFSIILPTTQTSK